MGKGICARKRMKQVAIANGGNLKKASMRKAGATAHLPLGDAPTKEDFVDRIPRSLQKMLKRKAAAENGFSHTRKQQQNVKGQKPQPNKSSTATATATGQGAAGSTAAAAKGGDGQEGPPRKVGPGGAGPDQRGFEKLLEGPAVKTLKKSKKEYLNKKKLKKKGKAPNADLTLLEQTLQHKGQVKFGERSDAPLEINLKRETLGIFLKQMSEAQQREQALRAGVPRPEATPAAQQGAGRKLGDSKQASEAEKEQLRLQVIEAYRAQKRGSSSSANMSSLAKLVKAGQ